jgi:hypothetical protein
MLNKYLYSFLKDTTVQLFFVFSLIAILVCFALFRLNSQQGLELKSLKEKQALILQIPSLQQKIIQIQGAVNGLLLSGIITTESLPMAVINSILVKVGDEIEGRKVMNITSKTVQVCLTPTLDKCMELTLQE